MSDNLRSRIRSKERLIGGWVTANSSLVTEAVASCGFDWVAIDMEHGISSLSDAISSIAVCERYGVEAFIRLPSADPFLARRLVDGGAKGLLVPVVEDAELLSGFTQHLRYPPSGRRGTAVVRANLWGDRFDDQIPSFQPAIIAMIETTQGVDVAQNVAALEDVDALFIGPYDLSASLGTPGNFATQEFDSAMKAISDAAEQNNIALGYHQVATDTSELQRLFQDGFSFVAYGLDLHTMREAMKGFKTLRTDK